MPEHDDHGVLSVKSLLDLVYKEGLDAAQWREIGTRLNLKPGTLNEIEWAHPRSPKECLLKMLNAWLKYDKTATLEKYKIALSECIPHHGISRQRTVCLIAFVLGIFTVYSYHFMESQPSILQPLLRYRENIKSLYNDQPDVPGIERLWYDKTLKFISPVFYGLNSQTFHVDKSKQLHFDSFFEFTGLGQRILIQGRPGTGKSTLVNRLTKEWSNNTKNSNIAKCPLLLRVTLRDLQTERPSGKNLNLLDILRFSLNNDIKHINDGLELEEYLSEPQHAKSLCIILDGLDEYPPAYSDPSNYIYKIIVRKQLITATVMVTARPEAYETFFETIGTFGFQLYELIGFDDNAIEEYVTRNMNNSKHAELFLYHLKKYYKRLYRLCSCPLHLAMIVKSYKYNNEFPVSLTEAYVKSLSKAFKREIGRKKLMGCLTIRLDDFSSLRKCEPILADTITNVSKLAFDSLAAYRNQPFDIKKMKPIQTRFSLTELHSYLPFGDDYGLLSPHYHKDSYETLVSLFSFPHLVIQEFWAAFHVTVVGVNTSELKDIFLQANFLYFICGMYSSSNTMVNEVFEILLQQDQFPHLLDLYTMCGLETGQTSQSLADTYIHLHGAVLNLDNLVPFSPQHVEVQFFLSFIHFNVTQIIFSQDSPSVRPYMDKISDIFPILAKVKIIVRWAESSDDGCSFDFSENLKLIFSRQKKLSKLEWKLPLKVLVEQEFLNCLDGKFKGEIAELSVGMTGSVVELPKNLDMLYEKCESYLWGHYSAVELTPDMFITALARFINYFDKLAKINFLYNTPVWYLECQYIQALFEALYKSSFYNNVQSFGLIDSCSGLLLENVPLVDNDMPTGVVTISLRASHTAVTSAHDKSQSLYHTLGVLPKTGCTNERLYTYFLIDDQKQISL